MVDEKPATRKVEDTDGTTWFEARDGSRYKTRAGAYKKSKKLESDEDPRPPSQESATEAKGEEVDHASKSTADPSPEPEWATFDWSDDDDPVEFVPGMLKKVRPVRHARGAPTKKQLEAEKQMNMAILKVGYRTGDYALTRWRRAVLQDPEAPAVRHTVVDYDWIADVTEEAVADQGLNIGAAVGPGIFAIGANAVWFGAPIMETRNQARKLGIVSKASIGFTKILERVPFLGKSIKARRLRREREEVAEAMIRGENEV